MAFKTVAQTQEVALSGILNVAIYVKAYCDDNIALLAGNVDSTQILNLVEGLRVAITRMDSFSGTPGLAAYAQSQYSDPTYDIVAEYTNMRSSLINVINWIVANFPKDANGFMLAYTLSADGSRVARLFSPTQTAGLRTVLMNAASTIN